MDLTIFSAPLQKLLGTFQTERHYQDDKREEALKAIQKALIESKKHVELSPENRENEFDLAHLWAEASSKIRYMNADLADRLNDKSKYWQDDFIWTNEVILEKQIDFDSIEKQIESLLQNS